MAFIPDEAEKRSNELSGKEWKLATLYFRFANRAGIAWPSLDTIAKERNWTKSNACKARAGLVTKGWLRIIEGDKVQLIVGFQNGNGNTKIETEVRQIVSKMEAEQQTHFQNGNGSVSKMEIRDFHFGNGSVSKMETRGFQNGNATVSKMETRGFQNGNATVSKMEIAYKEEPAHVEPCHEPEREKGGDSILLAGAPARDCPLPVFSSPDFPVAETSQPEAKPNAPSKWNGRPLTTIEDALRIGASYPAVLSRVQSLEIEKAAHELSRAWKNPNLAFLLRAGEFYASKKKTGFAPGWIANDYGQIALFFDKENANGNADTISARNGRASANSHAIASEPTRSRFSRTG